MGLIMFAIWAYNHQLGWHFNYSRGSEDYTLVCILLWSHKTMLHSKSRSAQQSIIWVKWF